MKNLKCLLWLGILWLAVSCVLAEEPTYQPPQLEQPDHWTMVVFPDPQQYTCEHNFPIYQIMMNWITENIKPLNIQNVVCVGDLVNNNKSDKQWEYTSRAFAKLDGKLPYVVCTGNHDHGGPKVSADTRDTQLDKYFPASRNPLWKNTLVEQMENPFGQKTLELAAYQTTAPGGQKLLYIALPFAPNDAMLGWAKSLTEKYADHFVILVTHQYLLPHKRGNLLDPAKNYQVQRNDGGANGVEIWEKLVKPAKNIRMVLCGHHSANNCMEDSVGFRMEKNDAGKTVYQMIFDTQALGGGFGGNGGDGWLRMLEFSKDMKRVKAYTFSPLFAISPVTQFLARDKADYCEFSFEID
ncbi:MAG: metallophosphoesterase [Planctomycetia bacterium]|nr:metallophosphoesterase [Planctomycetia bacterium]